MDHKPKVNLKPSCRSHALEEPTSLLPDVPPSPVISSPTEPPKTSTNDNRPASLNRKNPRPILKRDNLNQSSDSKQLHPKVNLKPSCRSHALEEPTSLLPDVPPSPVISSPTEPPKTSTNDNRPASLNRKNPRPILKRDNLNQSSDSKQLHGTAPSAAAPALPAVYYTPTPAATPPQPTNHSFHFTPRQCTFQKPQAPDRTAAPECNYPQPGVHNYFSRCPSAQQASSSYFVPTAASATAAAASMALMFPSVHTQAARPYHCLSTPPTTPQNVYCTPYAVKHYTYAAMPGCYQHCPGSNPQTPMTMPSMMRPAMQPNVGNSPPLRAMRPVGYNPPTAHSPVVPEAPCHNNGYVPPVQPSTSIRQTHRLSFPTNDYMMVGNPRVSTAFTPGPPTIRPLASVSFPPPRRNRSFKKRPSQLPGTFDSTPGRNDTDPRFAFSNDSRPHTVGPTPGQFQDCPIIGGGHQQAALLKAIESAGDTNSKVNDAKFWAWPNSLPVDLEELVKVKYSKCVVGNITQSPREHSKDRRESDA